MRIPWIAALTVLCASLSCGDPGGIIHDVDHFSVNLVKVEWLNSFDVWTEVDISDWGSGDPGDITNRLPYAKRTRITVEIDALPVTRQFDGFVQVHVLPGDVLSLTSETSEVTRTGVRVVTGQTAVVAVEVEGSFGEARLLVEDFGHAPGAPTNARCDDGEDNDGDGLVDYPQDPGCYLRNDDSEEPGGFAVGVSEPIYYANPRISDVQGCDLHPDLERQAITIDRGFMIVTAVMVNGFYVTDFGRYPDGGCDVASGCCDNGRYAHIFAFNFNTPWGLRVCDRLDSLGGIVGDFYGFTELNFPSWQRTDLDPETPELDLMRDEPHDITQEQCPIISRELVPSMLPSRTTMETYESALVHVTDAQLPTEWVNCDFNGNERVAYNSSYDETAPVEIARSVLGEHFDIYCIPTGGVCSEAECYETCLERSCAEMTNYREYGQYPVTIDGMPILVVTSSNIPDFDPYWAAFGQDEPVVIDRIGGVLKEFEPLETPWIIEPRCPQDLYIDGVEPYTHFGNIEIWQRCVPSEETGDYEDPY